MRPPRNISGSTSAAAAAAVAMAVATAAAANAQTGAGSVTNSSIGGDSGADWPVCVEEQATACIENESGAARAPSLLVRRASASGQLMRADESALGSTEASDASRGRRSLLSSSSSPTSLRALFNSGASTDRSPSLTSSEPSFQATSLNATNSIENTLGSQASGQDVHTSMTGGTNAGIDYFDHPINYSESSSSSSTPSGAIMTSGMPQFGYSVDSLPSTVAHLISPLSSPLCHAQPSSLPPTPLQLMAERLPDSIMTGASIGGLGAYSQNHAQFQSPTPHPRYGTTRRASSSSYVLSSYSTDNEIKVQQHDRRTSAPWATYSHSQSLLYDNRHLSQAQAGPSGVQSQTYGSSVHSVMKPYATTDDIQPYPTQTQSALMRSNSTPAALRSPLKSLNRNRHSALPSRRSHIIPARQSLNLYASTDKVIQDLSLPQKLYRHSALPQRHINNMSHLQFQLHLQQLQQSQQHGQRSQSLPRFQPDQSHRSPSQANILQWQGYGGPPQRQQETDINFDLGIDGSHDVDMGVKSIPLGHSATLGSEPSSDIPSADILSPIGTNSPAHPAVADFQSFGSHMGTPLDLGLGDDMSTNSSISGIAQQELLAQQHIHQQPPSDEQTSKLQFAPGYAWKQEPISDRIVQGHTRHQSASQVYPQPPLQFQSSAQQRANFTRSLQDLTRYTTVLVDQQHRVTDQTHFLTQEAPMPQASALDQGTSQDNFGASLAVDLNDHLRLLDDMDAMPEFNEYNDISQSSLLSTNHGNKEAMLQGSGIPNHPDQTIIGSPPGTVLNHSGQRSIFSSIPNSHNPLLLNDANLNSTLGQGTEIHHFHGGPYVDTLSFLDLSGSFMTSTPLGTPMPTAATSSSLPNTSFLDQRDDRLYSGFVPNLQQHSLTPTLHNPLSHQPPQGQGHQQQQQPPQQHIIHHHHHHHHIH
ncbi:hypothetical protein BGX27_008684 [Mortierella sp. AM989]|nr:hypothetical protein BGX27_008684 [Mortierella sp. AM989]